MGIGTKTGECRRPWIFLGQPTDFKGLAVQPLKEGLNQSLEWMVISGSQFVFSVHNL